MTLEELGNVANLITAVAAIAAVWVARTQIEKSRRQQVEAVARDHYQDFLRLSLEHPWFSDPEDHRIDPDSQTFDGDKEKFYQYESFLWSGLNALESLYFSIGDRPSWSATIASILDSHKKMLASEQVRKYTGTFEPEFRDFLAPWLRPGEQRSP